MSATETFRAMLDERGVEWDYGITGATTTRFSVNGIDLTFTPMRDGLVCSTILTPEQAIAATLGDVPRLPHFWTHDGALHIEATRMPTRIVVCEGGTCEFAPKRELDVSEAENAKLREENQSIGLAAYELGRKSMADENAKLRELVRELWAYAEQELVCDENCPYGDTCDWMEPAVVCVFRRRMRELGVEVDG